MALLIFIIVAIIVIFILIILIVYFLVFYEPDLDLGNASAGIVWKRYKDRNVLNADSNFSDQLGYDTTDWSEQELRDECTLHKHCSGYILDNSPEKKHRLVRLIGLNDDWNIELSNRHTLVSKTMPDNDEDLLS